MKKRIVKIIPLLVIWAILIACGFSNPLSPSATQTPYVITATSQTMESTQIVVENTPDGGGENPVSPTAEVLEPTAAQMQPTQASSGSQVQYGPAGILVYQDIEGMVAVYDSYGNKVGDVSTPGFSGYGPGRIYAYGLDVNNVNSLQLYYYSYDGSVIRRVTNGQTTDLVTVQYLANLKGFANTPYFLVGTGNFGSAGLDTDLVAYNFSSGVDLYTYMSTNSAESHVFASMLIKGSSGSPVSAYYTTEAYGIGGDIVYPVTYGLYHLDLASGSVHWLFNDEYAPSSISPDGTMAAIVHRDASGIGGMSVYELGGPSEIVTYDLLMGQDRGAGYGVFSPDNQRVAWMQAGGHMMAETPDFHSMLCYAHIGPGDVGTCLPATQLVVSAVAYPNSTAQPHGWLNNHELLYDAFTFQEPQHTLRVLDVNNGSVRDFTSGKFLGFIY